MDLFPAKIQDITPEMLTEWLRQRFPEVHVSAVHVVRHDRCGDGLASTADRVTLGIEFEGETDLPAQMILKTILLHPVFRFGMPMILGLGRFVKQVERIPELGGHLAALLFTVINIYQRYFPHAPEAMYANEVRFYRNIRPHVDIEAPVGYASAIESKKARFGILMEDLSLRDASFPNAVTGVGLEQMRCLIGNLVTLHATYWQSPLLDREFAWLPTTTAGGMYPVFDAIGLNLIRDQVAKNQFKQDLLAPLGRTVDQLWDLLWKSQRLIYRQPLTLLHGDTHIGNTYTLADGSAGFLDWQLMVKGPWCHDLNYLIATGLDPKTRRTHERDLVMTYLNALRDRGVANVPDDDAAWLAYRRTTIWGLVIGWLITPPQNYGIEITSTNISRMCDAMLDHETLRCIDTP